MAEIRGLTGFRPSPGAAAALTSPPYDVIKPGSPLEKLLRDNPRSLYHLILGNDPEGALAGLIRAGHLKPEEQPTLLVYEQSWLGGRRIGLLAAVKVDDYTQGNIIRHEKTFDEKVQGRIALARRTGLTTEPIFLISRSPIGPILEMVAQGAPDYEFISDFGGHNDQHGIRSRVFLISEESPAGRNLRSTMAQNPLYIADGHHRYHAALRNGQTHTLAYIAEKAGILAYDRVINGRLPFAEAAKTFPLEAFEFGTPPKNTFAIYTRAGSFLLRVPAVPEHVVERLDCSLLEKILYPALGLSHADILDPKHMDYYPERDLAVMKRLVDEGAYEIAVALHPVAIEEVLAVADAGRLDPEIVMPEKSTFFAPKILSGLFLYRHQLRS